jgi:hypothetical protein
MNSPPDNKSAGRGAISASAIGIGFYSFPRGRTLPRATVVASPDRARKVDAQSSDELTNPPADRYLADHILAHHRLRLSSSWELAFLQSLARLRGPLNDAQRAALAALWTRVQAVRS